MGESDNNRLSCEKHEQQIHHQDPDQHYCGSRSETAHNGVRFLSSVSMITWYLASENRKETKERYLRTICYFSRYFFGFCYRGLIISSHIKHC